MANKPHEFPKFTPIDDLTMKNMLDKMTKYLKFARIFIMRSDSEI